ncbi:ADP-ribosylglycohydrolase family protein [Xanthomonas cannabis]|uniref:ADP-ribosylglycohydrolase family protein n=1 Tax=Xanthomonas cannabis TaxID=1885674 RepID=UPI003203949F|nr:ADP-ribosylglycohydrolase [Xanthomonas cannabis]
MTGAAQRARFRGCLLGLAVGDALGTTLEFCAPGSFTPIDDMRGGGPFALQAGQWTDDTSMALCLAHSLLHRQGFDAADQMNRFATGTSTGISAVPAPASILAQPCGRRWSAIWMVARLRACHPL